MEKLELLSTQIGEYFLMFIFWVSKRIILAMSSLLLVHFFRAEPNSSSPEDVDAAERNMVN